MPIHRLALCRILQSDLIKGNAALCFPGFRFNFTAPPPSAASTRLPALPEEESIALIVARHITAKAGLRSTENEEHMPLELLVQEISKTFPNLSDSSRVVSLVQNAPTQMIELISDAEGHSFIKLQGITAGELLKRSATPYTEKGSADDMSPFEGKILRMVESFLEDTTINSTVYMAVDTLYHQVMKKCALYAPGDPIKDVVAKQLKLRSFISMLGIHDAFVLSESTGSTDHAEKHLVRERFWVLRYHATLFVALHCRGAEKPPYFSLASRTMVPSTVTSRREFGGWGSAAGVPSKEDVYEILKYVPVQWGSFSNLSIPPAVRKKHIRTSSPLMWFRRQPCYFELREINYTTEIRRSIVLHPETHQMTLEEANELLALQMTFWEANSLAPLDSDGKPLEEQSSFEKNVLRFFARVCPTYFSPLGIILQRYTKKNMTAERLLGVAQAAPHEFEIVRPMHAHEPLVRRRGGADSERWRAHFLKDLESCPEDVVSIIDIFNVLTPVWDRPEYVYVRLAQKTKERLRGYDGLLQLLRRHPQLFKVGNHFVSRVGASNPLFVHSKEPLPDDMTSRTVQCEENPYLSPLELAKVFHYIAPQHEGCTVSFLVDAASPAMRIALPPQVITILQQFPRLFACKENSPGEFIVYKITTSADGRSAATPGSSNDGAEKEPENYEEDDSWILEEEQAVGKELGREQTMKEVCALVPDTGVNIAQLLLWTSLPVQQAAIYHYGGLLKMLESDQAMFRVIDTAEGKMIYRASSTKV